MPTDTMDQLGVPERLALHLSAAPAGFFMGPSESLQVSSLSSVAATVTVTGIMLDLSGVARPFTFDHVANTNRTLATTTFKVGEGWLLQVTARVASGSPLIGQTWARVQAVRGDNAGAFVLATLATRYITSIQSIHWPGGAAQSTIEGRGVVRAVAGADPAAGAEITETVPTGALWRLIAMQFTLVTDATVANRNPRLTFDDGTNVYATFAAADNQAASTTNVYTAAAALNHQAIVANRALIGLPAELMLPAGHRIRTSTNAIVAGDNYGAPQLLIEEWLQGAA